MRVIDEELEMRVIRTGVRYAILGTAAACVLSLLSPVSGSIGALTGVPRAAALAEDGTTADGLASPEQIAAQVAEVPAEMRSAIERDLGITAEEYVTRSLTASAVVDVMDQLHTAGVATLGAEVTDGTAVVYVADDRGAEAVEAVGLRAVVGAPSAYDASPLDLEFMEDLRGGTGYTYPDAGTHRRCSLGIAGFAVASGAQQALTAGHCLGDESAMRRTLVASRPSEFSGISGDLGRPVPGSYRLGDGYDHGLIAVGTGHNAVPELLTWGGGAGAPMASAPVVVRDATRAVVGAPICRTGSTTGWRCGEVVAVDTEVSVSGSAVNTIVASVCSRPGDSGGAAVSGTTAVGITSGGTGSGACTSDDVTVFAPLYSSGPKSAHGLYNGGWEPRVAVDRPVVAPRSGFDFIEGTVPHGTPRHRVVVVIDGSITRTATVSSSGSWRVDVSDIGFGSHSYVAQAWWGARSSSATVSGTWSAVTSERLYGASRYETAVQTSEEAFPSGADIVFIASGENYPDALSAGPVAAKMRGPLLLTPRGSLPTSVADELTRLDPDRIIVVGGTAAISSGVEIALGEIAPTERLAGSNRYETSRNVASFGFTSADRAFVATGRDFPDALSASAAAAFLAVPVVLVDGKSSEVDTATRDLLESLDLSHILVAGGPAVVSEAMKQSLGGLATTERLAGTTRYGTSLSVNQYAHADASTAYFALGTNFPDALTGGVLAGLRGAPMYITPSSCVAPEIADHISALGVSHVALFGGPAVLSSRVAELDRC